MLTAHNATTEIVGSDQLRITDATSEQIGLLAAEHTMTTCLRRPVKLRWLICLGST